MVKIEDTGLHCDYSVYFKDKIYREYFSTFDKRLAAAKNDDERLAHFRDIRLLTTLYCTVVYYIYPNVPKFKELIDSDKELSANFKAVKKRLDENGGPQTAELFMRQAFASLQPS